MEGASKILRWLGAGAALLIIGQCTVTRTSYGAICARCLQHVSGRELAIFGFTVSRQERMTQGHGGLMSPDIFGPPISPADPKLYQEITGKPCHHTYMRTGFCRSTWGMTACGSYGKAQQYKFRNSILHRTYEAYSRVKDKDLARETMALLDDLYPIVSNQREIEWKYYQPPTWTDGHQQDPLSSLHDGLGIIENADDWRELLRSTRAGEPALMVTDLPELIARVRHPTGTVRQHALYCLVALDQPAAWKEIASCLNDAELRNAAIRSILMCRQFDYWPQALSAGVWPPSRSDTGHEPPFQSIVNESLGTLDDGEIKKLLRVKDPFVELVCLEQIRSGCRYEFLDDVLQILNETPTPFARKVLGELLTGPSPFLNKDHNGISERQPLAWLLLAVKPSSAGGWGVGEGNRPTSRILREVAPLARAPAPQHWPALKQLTEEWDTEGGNDHYFAALASAMHACDATKTRDWLVSRLRSSMHDEARAIPTLSAMGAIADPAFLEVVEEFGATSRIKIYSNDHYRKPFEYAVHHCRQMHRWKLQELSDGSYVIQKPDHPPSVSE